MSRLEVGRLRLSAQATARARRPALSGTCVSPSDSWSAPALTGSPPNWGIRPSRCGAARCAIRSQKLRLTSSARLRGLSRPSRLCWPRQPADHNPLFQPTGFEFVIPGVATRRRNLDSFSPKTGVGVRAAHSSTVSMISLLAGSRNTSINSLLVHGVIALLPSRHDDGRLSRSSWNLRWRSLT